jgi:hypothetical protein
MTGFRRWRSVPGTRRSQRWDAPTPTPPTLIPGNLLTLNQQDVETDASGWTGINANIGRTSANPHTGLWALTTTSQAAGDTEAVAISRFGVTPGHQYTLTGWCRPSADRNALVYIAWYAGGVWQSVTGGSSTAVTAGTYTQVTLANAAAPAGVDEALVNLRVTSLGAGEAHQWDTISALDTGAAGGGALTVNAGLSFTGTHSIRTQHGLNATLNFTSTLLRRITRTLVAALSTTGALTTQAVHQFTQTLTAALGFAGVLPRRVNTRLSGALSFAGTLPRTVRSVLNSLLAFNGVITRTVFKRVVGTVTFGGSSTRRIGRILTSTVNFTSLLTTAAVHTFTQLLTASVSFTGSLTTSAVHFFTQTLTASLSFASTLRRAIFDTQSASVAFTGALPRRVGTTRTAMLSFTGAQTRRVLSLQTATLSFTSSLVRRIARTLTAVLSSTGLITTAAVHFFTKVLPATMGFTGALSTRRIFGRVLTASLGMTSSLARRAGKLHTAIISFTGTQTHRINTQLSGSLSFVGFWSRVPTLLSALSNLREFVFGREPDNTVSGVSYRRNDGLISGREDGT